MTPDQRMEARFAAAERARRKKTLFQLADDEETLTHSGRAIADIEKFEDPRSDDEGPEDEEGKKLDGEKKKHTHLLPADIKMRIFLYSEIR